MSEEKDKQEGEEEKKEEPTVDADKGDKPEAIGYADELRNLRKELDMSQEGAKKAIAELKELAAQ